MLAGEAANCLSSTSVVGELVTVWQPASAVPPNMATARMRAAALLRLARWLRSVVIILGSIEWGSVTARHSGVHPIIAANVRQ
jgi:hypothetical protein